jgi:hypothetical protein
MLAKRRIKGNKGRNAKHSIKGKDTGGKKGERREIKRE